MVSLDKNPIRALTYQTAGSSWEVAYKPWFVYYYIQEYPRRKGIGIRTRELGGWFQ